MRLEVKIVNNPHGVNIRKSGSSAAAKIGWLAYGETAIVVNKQNGWYQLNVDGWISADASYVKVVKDLENKTPSKTTTPAVKTSNKEPVKSASSQTNASIPKAGSGMVFKDLKGNPQKPTEALETYVPTVYSKESGLETFEGVVPWNDDYVAKNMHAIRMNFNTAKDPSFPSTIKELFHKFNRYRIGHPDLYSGKTFSHVFFTRPDINILKNGETDNALGASGTIAEAQLNDEAGKDPVLFNMFNSNKEMLLSLTKHLTWSHDFNTYLSNAAESLDIADEFIDSMEHGETFTGYKIKYARHNVKSTSAGSFSVSYKDDYQATIYKMHKAWVEYMSKVYRGELTPKREYVKKRILDYACSVYYFILGPDGETIIYWTKYFGVFPTNTPASAYSWSKGANVRIPDITINYDYSFKEDFDPLSLAEFNMNSQMDLIYMKTYEKELATTGHSSAGAPFVETIKDSKTGEYVHKLRFRKDYRQGR